MAREDEIRTIAYGIWDQEGRGDGHDREHWLKAEVMWEHSQRTGAAPEKALPRIRTVESATKSKGNGRQA